MSEVPRYVSTSVLENPPPEVMEAMAKERARQMRSNGHGEHGFRDLWIAGVNALRKGGVE